MAIPALCKVCNHPDRLEIEECLGIIQLNLEGSPSFTDLSEQFNLSSAELQIHMLRHLPSVVSNMMGSSKEKSLAGDIKYVEADLLRAAANDFYLTLIQVGAQIRGNNKVAWGQKAILDLYTQVGAEMRNNIDALVKMQKSIVDIERQDEGINSDNGILSELSQFVLERISEPKDEEDVE